MCGEKVDWSNVCPNNRMVASKRRDTAGETKRAVTKRRHKERYDRWCDDSFFLYWNTQTEYLIIQLNRVE